MPSSGIIDKQTFDQGQRTLYIRQGVRKLLEKEGMSLTGIQELQNLKPVTDKEDRRLLNHLVSKSLQDRVLAGELEADEAAEKVDLAANSESETTDSSAG